MIFEIRRIWLKKSRVGADLDIGRRMREGDEELGRISNEKK